MGKVILDQAASWSRSLLASPSPPQLPTFLSVIWRYGEGGCVYASRFAGRKLGDFHEDELEKVPRFPIPQQDYQPPWDPLITQFACSSSGPGGVGSGNGGSGSGSGSGCGSNSSGIVLDAYTFVKTPRLVGYDGTPGIAQKVRQEISILEQLRKHPHPNICEYYGCFVDEERGLVAGVAIRRYVCTLSARLEKRDSSGCGFPPFYLDVVVEGIAAGIKHLHSLGLAHNDLNPTNVMLDASGNPVIIDFNNCVPFGHPCGSGTPGYTNFSRVSSPANDQYGYHCILRYLQRKIHDAQMYNQYYSHNTPVAHTPVAIN